jgi:hypothetical protein
MAQGNWRAIACACVFASATVIAQTPRDRPVAPEISGTAAIAGRMTIATPTGVAPIRHARIILEGAALRDPKSADTDTDGRYRFDKLPAGSYRITGEKAGFTPAVRDPRRAFEKPPLFDLAAGQTLTRDLQMQRGAAIEGRLLKDNGEPAINVVVSAVRVGYSDTGRTPMAVRQARTNDLGRFRIHSLPPGDYLVDAAPDPLEASNQPQTPGPRLPVLARTYFPGSARLEDGRIVTLAPGQDLGSIDFSMTSMVMSALAGGIFNAAGEPQINAFPRLQRVGGVVGEVRGFGSVESNTFGYRAVPPGEFWLMAVTQAAPGGNPEYAAMKIRSEGIDQPALRVITQPGAPAQGRIQGANLPQGLRVVAVETEYVLPSTPGEAPQTWTVPVDPGGVFSFKTLFGPRLFRVLGLPDDWALAGVWSGDQNISDTPIEISGAAPPAPLRIAVTNQTGTLAGIARDANGAPVAGARVVVFGEDERAWGRRSRVIKTIETGPDGRYELRGLLEGKYSVAAVSFLEDGAWFDTAVLQNLKRTAATLAVISGKQTLDLVVKP